MLDKNNGMTIGGVIALQMALSEENQSQSAKQTIHPNQIGQETQIQLISRIPSNFRAKSGSAHMIDIPRLGPANIVLLLDLLNFIALSFSLTNYYIIVYELRRESEQW